jgi:diadenosine tetraphosphate (Ap4A) HIT family hydrolase
VDRCPFCEKIECREFAFEDGLAVAFPDAYPLSPGHTLIVPRRHERNYFDLTDAEEVSIWQIMRTVRAELDERLSPQGYNVGINVGRAGGQTVDHVHVHVVPRYAGDVNDPRGGIRWVIPAKALYWIERKK